jgi:hypothetical protein
MKSYDTILQNINTFHELGETIQAAHYVLKEYGLEHENLKGFELREKALPSFILMTTEGIFGEQQIIRIPENTFEFEFRLMLNLLAHEMVHVIQKTKANLVEDKNEREWQAYYEMLFHKIFPLVPDASNFQRKNFAVKGIEYYNRMGEGSELQKKYAGQKKEVDDLLTTLV